MIVCAAALSRHAAGSGPCWPASCWAAWSIAFLPLEVYELIKSLSPLKFIALGVNLAIVAYLLYAKRLFGIRGGGAAEEALRERDVGWQALERTAPTGAKLAPASSS